MRKIDRYLLEKTRLKEQSVFNNANPKLSVQVTRARTTIMDSSYWTVELMRKKEGLGDTSVATRRFKAYGPPNRIYNIYVDNGLVKTATREYPDYFKLSWQNQFELGPGKAVAIAFDGYWERYRNYWQLLTEENPYLFWTDTNDTLWVQLWDDENTRLEIAEEVVKVKAIRAWKNVNILDHDQGLVAAYIKTDGKVYYRNLCLQANGKFVWEYEKEVTEFTGVAENINLFLSNDYRLGFIIQDINNEITMLLTIRNWAGIAIEPNKFSGRIKAGIEFIALKYHKQLENHQIITQANSKVFHLYAREFNSFRNIENVEVLETFVNEEGEEVEVFNYGKIIEVVSLYRLHNLNPLDFILSDSRGINFTCIELEEIEPSLNNYRYRLSFNDFNNAKGLTRLICRGEYTKNDIGGAFNSFEISFLPRNLVPIASGPPEPEEVWNE